jgi:uncharacterized protein
MKAAMGDTPVIVLNGARQVGKTTLVSSLPYPGTYEILTLDDPTTRESAKADPRSFLQRPVDSLVIDEAQLEPTLFRAIKAEVDRERRPGRFILTGSSRLLAAPDMADSLVGRVEVIELRGLSQGEVLQTNERFVDQLLEPPRTFRQSGPLERLETLAVVLRGGYPEAVQREAGRRGRWFDSYIQTATGRVLKDISAIERASELPTLLRFCAARTSLELNTSSLASELGIPPRTTAAYLGHLSSAFLLQLIPAWSTNLSSKVVHRPKLVLSDSGLAAHLCGVSERNVSLPTSPLGQLLETFVANELAKQIPWSQSRPSLWHFRDRSGAEVDLVLEYPDGRIVGIEVKATSSPTSSDFKGLRFLNDRLGDRFVHGVLLTLAPEANPFGDKLTALPVSALWNDS